MTRAVLVLGACLAAAACGGTARAASGSWVGTYGSQGYDIAGAVSSLPAYASVTLLAMVAYVPRP